MSDPYSSTPIFDPESGFATANSSASVSQAANDLRAAAGEKVREVSAQAASIKEKALETAQNFRVLTADKTKEIRAAAAEQWEGTRDKAKEFHVTAEEYIREHPTKCVLSALGAGFLIGLIVRR